VTNLNGTGLLEGMATDLTAEGDATSVEGTTLNGKLGGEDLVLLVLYDVEVGKEMYQR
jgi:hypothetical protein